MNTLKKGLAIGAIAGLSCISAFKAAAQPGFDLYESTRTLILANTNVSTATGFTNGWSEHRVSLGQAFILCSFTGNSGAANNYATVRFDVSADQTNITTVTNYALISSNSQSIFTNFYWGSNSVSPVSTNYVLRPGIPTNPNAAVAGFNTGYLAETGTLQFTNGGSIAMLATNTVEMLGFTRIEAQPLYIRATAILTNGVGTNVGVTITLTSPTSLFYQ